MDPWFDSQTAGMVGGIIGASAGIIGAVVGSLTGICLQKGWKKLLYGLFIFALAIGSILLTIGIVAFICKQPKYVWYSFLLPGFICTVIFSFLLPTIPKRFTQYELRKMQAKDL